MRKKKKWMWLAGRLLAVILAAGGCGQSGEKPVAPGESQAEQGKGKTVIGATLSSDDSQYMQLLARHMGETAKEKGVELKLAYAQWNVETQTRQLEEFVEEKVDAIILSPVNAKSLLIPLKEVAKAGIPLINLNMKVDAISSAYISTYVGSSSSEEAALAASVFIDLWGEEGGEVAIIEGDPGSDPQIYRTQTFMEQLTPHPQIEIVGISNGGWDREKSRLAAYDMLQKNPDLKGLYCQDCNMALGAVEALEELGRAGQVAVVGISDEEEYLQAVEDGKLTALISQPSEYEGRYAVHCAMLAAQGETLRPWYKDPIKIVTKENVAEYRRSSKY